MTIKGYVNINGISYDCHEEIEKMFSTLHQNQMKMLSENDQLRERLKEKNKSLEEISKNILNISQK